MRLPFVHSGVVDVIISALRAGGYLTDDASADAIRNCSAQLTELDRDTISAGLHYGGGGGGGSTDRIISAQDVYALVDSDDTNPTTPYTNYFYVLKSQATVPSIDFRHEIMSIGSESGGGAEPASILRVGPRTSPIGLTVDVPAILYLGHHRALLETHAHGTLSGGPLAVSGIAPGLSISSSGHLELVQGCSSLIAGIDHAPIIFRHWNQTKLTALTFVQESEDQFTFRTTRADIAADPTIFFSGSHTDPVSDPRIKIAIGGSLGGTDMNPADVDIGAGYGGAAGVISSHTCTVHVVSPRIEVARHCALSVFHKGEVAPDNTHIVNFRSRINCHGGAAKVRLFSVHAQYDAERVTAFEVRGNTDIDVYAWHYVSVGLDLAENFLSHADAATYEKGTVVVMDDAGNVVPSSQVGDRRVVGVVSTQAGVTLGDGISRNADLTKLVPIALSGTVPVLVTTVQGSIEIGDLLVSAPGGQACREEDPEIGTVLGKALEPLIQEGNDPVVGKIKMLVMNR